jgi:hypothetical protein
MVNSYFDGYLISSDSSNYLLAAREILRGNGFYVYPDWFAVWPIGYPFLIAVISFITGAEVYFASRIIAVVLVWIIGLTVWSRFKQSAWVYALVMLNFGFLNIFYFAWSESVFILGLFLLSLWVSDIITEANVRASHYIKLVMAVLILFLSRYVGAFALVVIGLLWIWSVYLFVKSKAANDRKRGVYLSVSGIVSATLIFGYLLMNRMMTGYMTGMPRVPVGDVRELIINLFTNQGSEMKNVFRLFFDIENYALVILLWLLFAGFIIRMIYQNWENIKKREKDVIMPLVFIVIGGIYWIAIVVMRFISAIDDFNYRLLFPSTFLLFIGFIGFLLRGGKINFKPKIIVCILAAVWLIIAVLTAEIFTPRSIAPHNYAGYKDMEHVLLMRYSNVPDGAVVIDGDIKLIFIRENVRVAYPGTENIDIEALSAEYADNTGIFVNIATEAMREIFGHYQIDNEVIVRVR